MSLIERKEAVDTFQKVAVKINHDRSFTADEKKATKVVATMMRNIAEGWGQAGTKRMKEPTKTALYFRWKRAREAVEEAERNWPMGNASIAQLHKEVEVAEKEYRDFMAKQKQKEAKVK